MYKPLGRFFQGMLPYTSDIVGFIKHPEEYREQLLEWLMPEYYDAVETVDILVGAWCEMGKPELDTVDSHDDMLHLGTFANALVDRLLLDVEEYFNYVTKEAYAGHYVEKEDASVAVGVYTYLGDGKYLRSKYTGPLDVDYFEIEYQEDDELASLDVTNDAFVMNGNYTMFHVPWGSVIYDLVPQDGGSYFVFRVGEYMIVSPVDPKTHEPKEW